MAASRYYAYTPGVRAWSRTRNSCVGFQCLNQLCIHITNSINNRQYMVAQEQNVGLSLSSDTFRQLKDRRRNRTSRQANEAKNPSILRFGSLSVKVKKTTEAFNNYFGESSRKTSWTEGMSNGSADSSRMPPPKFGPIKKRKSKRSLDYGKGGVPVISGPMPLNSVSKSAPVTPVERSPSKEQLRSDDSDSEYGFDAGWSGAR